MNWRMKALAAGLLVCLVQLPAGCGGSEEEKKGEQSREPARQPAAVEKKEQPRPEEKKGLPRTELDRLLAELESGNVERKILASYKIRTIPSNPAELKEKCAALYAQAVRKPQFTAVTTNLMLALVKSGPEGAGRARKLIREEPPKTRPQLILSLAGGGESSVEPLRDILNSDDIDDSRAAAQALAKLGPKALPALGDLRKRAAKWTSTLDGPYVRAIGAIGPQAREAMPELVAVLKEETASENVYQTSEPDFRLVACSDAAAAMIRMGSAAVPDLVNILTAPAGGRRITAAMALAAIGPDAAAAVPKVHEIAQDAKARTDHELRLRAACIAALGRLGPEGIGKLGDLLASTAARVEPGYIAAGLDEGIRSAGPALSDRVEALFNRLSIQTAREPNEIVIDAIRSMGRGVIADVRRKVADKNALLNVRLNAAAALGRFGAEARDALPDLKAFMAELTPTLWKAGHLVAEAAVVNAIAGINPDSPEAVASLCDVFARQEGGRAAPKPFQAMRRAVLEALCTMSGAKEAHVVFLVDQWKKIQGGDRTTLALEDQHLLIRAIATLGGQHEKVMALLQETAGAAGLTPQCRYEATVALLGRGVWTVEAVKLLQEAQQNNLDFDRLCGAIEKVPQAAENSLAFYRVIDGPTLDVIHKGRPAYMMARIDAKSADVDKEFVYKVARAFGAEPPAKVGDIKQWRQDREENLKWVLKLLAEVAPRIPPSPRIIKDVSGSLADAELRQDAVAAVRALCKGPEKDRTLAALRLEMATTMDEEVEKILGGLIGEAEGKPDKSA